MKNKGNLLQKIGLPIALIAGLGTGLSGCASLEGYMGLMEANKNYKETGRIAEELGVRREQVENLGNGYHTTTWGEKDLETTANIVAGRMKVQKIQGKNVIRYISEGTLSGDLPEGIFDKACELADRDKDRIITNDEAGKLLMIAYEVATKGQ